MSKSTEIKLLVSNFECEQSSPDPLTFSGHTIYQITTCMRNLMGNPCDKQHKLTFTDLIHFYERIPLSTATELINLYA